MAPPGTRRGMVASIELACANVRMGSLVRSLRGAVFRSCGGGVSVRGSRVAEDKGGEVHELPLVDAALLQEA
jgi:hypothetical protein